MKYLHAASKKKPRHGALAKRKCERWSESQFKQCMLLAMKQTGSLLEVGLAVALIKKVFHRVCNSLLVSCLFNAVAHIHGVMNRRHLDQQFDRPEDCHYVG